MSKDLTGIPIALLHESEGHTVTVELKNGNLYRGHLLQAEDNMNCLIEGVSCTAKTGKTTNLEQVYLRGSQIRFFVLPDMLRHAPMFRGRKVAGGGGRGKVGRGRGGVNARAAQAGGGRGGKGGGRGRGAK